MFSRHAARLAAVLAACCATPGSGAFAADLLPPAVLIRSVEGGVPQVVSVYNRYSPEVAAARGILVYADRGQDAWQVLPAQGRTARAADAVNMVSRFAGRAESAVATSPEVILPATVQLEQLLGQAIVRGASFLTPPAGAYLLNPKITIRRRAALGGAKSPPQSVEIRRGDRVVVRFDLAEGQDRLAWNDIPNLPETFRQGLPPGEYTIRAAKSNESSAFTIEPFEVRRWVMELAEELAGLLGDRAGPLYLQVAAVHLLSQTDESGRPRPYAADALDLLESVPGEKLTRYLASLRERTCAQLERAAGGPLPASAQAGGGSIESVRRLIDLGQWEEALGALGKDDPQRSARDMALATLYRAVILAESGQASEAETDTLFQQAVAQLQQHPADIYRAHNNYANFLLARCQDRLYNHAFQIASGVSNPLIRALVAWQGALHHYMTAWTLAEELAAAERGALLANIARLYGILADVIRTLDAPAAGARGFADGENAAADYARAATEWVLKSAGDSGEDATLAAAHETLSQLAFRQGDFEACQAHCEVALARYLQCGALAGVESVYRTIGMAALGEARAAGEPTAGALRAKALQSLRCCRVLSDFLRGHVPPDRLGLSRAGFLSRRAYVNRRIAELFIEQGRAVDALDAIEAAKARSLQDVLAAGAVLRPAAGLPPRPLGEILADWPADVAALEYFLSDERAWVFLVNTRGEVSAHRLSDEAGRPLASPGLVARIRSFLAGLDHQADAMRRRLADGAGFDHAWQDDLHKLYRELIPGDCVDKLREARTLLVVPHHILHYFPFAALVTNRDAAERAPDEMVKPRFLIDEPFNISHAPSLAAWDLLREKGSEPIRQVTAAGVARFQQAPPLPGVEKDLENLRTVFGDAATQAAPAGEATETSAKALFARRGLLFLATHGKNFADQPLSSYLLFHPDGENDGFLTAREIYGLDVAADLVVLSACYSGLADRSPLPGDDLFGLRRALVQSGARCVIAGLWDVYDGTGPELMHGFFQGLAKGKTAPEALADAERGLLMRLRASNNVEPWLHPYFWAVYSAIGDDRTRFDPQALEKTGSLPAGPPPGTPGRPAQVEHDRRDLQFGQPNHRQRWPLASGERAGIDDNHVAERADAGHMGVAVADQVPLPLLQQPLDRHRGVAVKKGDSAALQLEFSQPAMASLARRLDRQWHRDRVVAIAQDKVGVERFEEGDDSRRANVAAVDHVLDIPIF